MIAGESTSIGRDLAQLSTVSARPTFELQFSLLQNGILDRISEKIQEYQDDTKVNRVDAFLTLEKKRLERIIPSVDQYVSETGRNFKITNGLLDDLYELLGPAAGDADAFDKAVAQLDDDLTSIKSVNGLAIGLNVKDGMLALRDEGFGIGDYASYANYTERSEAVYKVISRVENALTVMTNNLDGALNFKDSVDTKITAVTVQIQAVQAADQTEQLNEIEKLRNDSAQLLNALSLAFETNLARSEAFAEQLLNPQINEGTVLDILA
jgi:hypothetical protein